MRKNLYIGVVSGFALSLSLGIVWNAAWEGRPVGTELASDLDLFIQEFKDEVGDRGSVESIYGVGSDDNGLLRLGSARAFLQNAAPTDLFGPGQYDSSAGAFVGTPLATEEIGASLVDLGTGRLWLDADGLSTATTLDDNQLNVWVDTVGFMPVRAEATGALQVGTNLIYNGSFEVTDGTGSAASTAVPSGWVLLLTPTLAYDDPTAVTEGEGIALETIGAGAANEGVTQTLTALKADTDYVIRARARPVTAADTCDLQVTGGDSTQTDTSAVGTNVFETLEVVVNTTAVPGALVVRLEANADTDECDWDHVTAFEQRAVVAPPGAQFCRATDATTGAAYYVNGAWTTVGTTCTITVPGPGYAIKATGSVFFDNDSGVSGGALLVRLQENINGGGAATVALGSSNVDIIATSNVVVGFLRTSPAPGATHVFTMDGRTNEAGGADLDRNIDDAGETHGETITSWLLVELIPTR